MTISLLSRKPEFVNMYAAKSVVRVVFIVLALTCTLAMGQGWEPPIETSLRWGDLPEYRLYASAAQGGNVNRAGSDKVFDQASSSPFYVSDLTSPVSDQRASTEPLTTDLHTDSDDGCRSPCCNSPCPTCYGQVEALFLHREPRFSRQTIVVDPNTDTTFVSTSDLDFDFDPGLRATIGVRICGGRALEFTYFGLAEGNGDAVAASSDPNAFLIFPDNLFGNVFVNPGVVNIRYSSSLNSFELNLPCCCGCCDKCGDECGCGEDRCRSTEWFAGFRYINISEELNISAQRTVAGGLEEGSYDIRTTNHLYGVQVGARERRTRGRFGWEATGKVGIFGNDAHQEQTVTDFPNFQIRPTVSTRGGQVAFIGDTNLSALYRLTEVWNLRAGYNLIWIEGLALAPDQLDFDFASATGGSQLHSGGGIFLHGVNVGVEARW
jgi:hypothetical protein